jgi:hypothetical protein
MPLFLPSEYADAKHAEMKAWLRLSEARGDDWFKELAACIKAQAATIATQAE